MTTRRVVSALSLLLVLAAGLVFAPAARADSQVRIVRLSLVDGPVQIDRATGQGFEKAIMNMPITQGIRISTPDSARAEVEFEDGTTMRLAPSTDVALPQLGLRSSGARFTTVQVDHGTAYFNIRHKGEDDFRVAFGNRVITVDHNVHFRLDLAGGNPELAVFKGELDVQGPQERAKVKKNETLTLDSADPDRYDIAKNIAPDSYDSWDSERLDYASQYASSSYNARSPYYYGVSDLNYYGAWSSYPGYGTLWRPFGVGYGWDPFYNGAWAWYPGFGYTWVSSYPWGWTPYRYGSWVFLQNYGWCWRPGGWNTWYTVPPVYNAPSFFHGPKPPPPVTVVGGGGISPHHPTVIVDNGVAVIRNPRGSRPVDDGFVPDRRGMRPSVGTSPVAGTAASGGSSFTPSTAGTAAPVPGTGIAAPGSPIPMRGGRSNMRTRTADQDQPMRMGARSSDRGAAPATRVDRGAPAPRVERSAPSAPRSAPSAPHSSPPSGGGHSGGISSGGHSSGGGRSPK
jgi:hypothetical protein